MNILAIEFSSPRRSVALSVNGAVVAQASEEGTRETHAFALIEKVLARSSAGEGHSMSGLAASATPTAIALRQSIDCVAVGVGPGSYAGVRIAIAIAQGWHIARKVELLGISSADAVAAQAHGRGWRGKLHTVIDAQRNELFAAVYDLDEQSWRLASPFSLLSPSEPRPAGSRYVRFDVLEHPTDQCIIPEAATIATLAGVRTDFVQPSDLEPVYLRKAEFVKAPPPRLGPIL